MILKKLVIHGYGPFSTPTSIDIDENVTVFTGQNDVGKSSILRLIRLICGDLEPNEDDQNLDHKYRSGLAWHLDNTVTCKATFVINDTRSKYLRWESIQNGYEVDILFEVITKNRQIVDIRNGSSHLNIQDGYINGMPKILYLPLVPGNEISSTFTFETANWLEQQLLILAFGLNPQKKFTEARPEVRARDIQQANNIIYYRLNQILPYSLGIKLSLNLVSYDPFTFSINFEDWHDGITPIIQRGSGVKKIVNLLIALSTITNPDEQIYILFDEPENSLHADAQHKLRGFLESLGKHSHIQVLYSTHSSSMINPIRTSGLRLMERAFRNGYATSTIDNQPYRGNFQIVRTSLGMSPADSLLYSPVTIITEGVTEVLALPYLLERFAENKTVGFEKIMESLSLSHFVDGEGNNFEYWCRLAKSQGAKPIIFVDGDKIRRVNQQDVKKHHPDVPIFHLNSGEEFEDIVPKETYFKALAQVNKIEATYDDFIEWQEKALLPKHIMFSKRVGRWLEECFPDTIYYKQHVMRRALEIVDLSTIKHDIFLKFAAEISKLLGESNS